MNLPQEAIELEERSLGPQGEPTLAAAFDILAPLWDAGERDRELGLHLMFLSWYLMIEPGFLTGLHEDERSAGRLQSLFDEVHRFFLPSIRRDAEMLYAVGLMAHLAPWLLGDNAVWEERSRDYRQSYRSLAPNGMDPAVFRDRGAYGDYFASHARLQGSDVY